MTWQTGAQAPRLTVVVMAFNEAASLVETVGEIQAELAHTGLAHEVLIVDDGSNDGTAALADQLGERFPAVRVVHHHANLGLGGVYRTGFTTACGELITFFPADGQFPASIVSQFMQQIDGRDMVLGYVAGRREKGLGKTLSWCERRLYEAVVGITPRFQGVLMFRRHLLERFPPQCTGRGWGVLMEFIIKVHRGGAATVSVPTSYRPRLKGRSKVNNWRTIRANLVELWVVRDHLSSQGGHGPRAIDVV
ncbi:MAG TPA: glycosyltransferase family 2 protein [Gemmatimonadales bacterium]